LDFLGRDDVLELDAVDLDAPWVGCFIEDEAHFGIDQVTRGQGLVQLEIADDVTQRCGGEILDCHDRILDAVGIQFGIGDLVEKDCVDLHRDIVLGDHGLGLEIGHLLLEGDDLDHPVDERNLDMDTGMPGGVVGAESFDDEIGRLRYDADVSDQDGEQDKENEDEGNE